MIMKYSLPLFLMSASGAIAAQQDACAPTAPVCHTQDDCACTYCLGPATQIANAPVRPYTCNGDWEITLAGFYWKPSIDGLEYAVLDSVQTSDNPQEGTRTWNDLIDAELLSPHFEWDFGFKLGIGYNTTCDGWDIGVTWTSFTGHANSHDETNFEENTTLFYLWSAFKPIRGDDAVSDIKTAWKVDLNLIDIELGREYWASPRFSLRPFVGLRIGNIDQSYTIEYKGLAFKLRSPEINQNDEVNMDLDYKGVGVRGGFDMAWHLSCGFSIVGELAPSIVYGRFDFDHDEVTRFAETPFTKTKVLETSDSFRASRAMLDLELGLSWFGLFCDCKYGIGAKLAWEQHHFFHMNQFWRVKRNAPIEFLFVPNDNGENVFYQRRGSLSTDGWTLTLQFDF